MAERLLDVRGLSKTFPGLRALDDVSLAVDAGEIVAVVGQNGSGKSTLVKTLAGVHAPDPGAAIDLGSTADGPVGLHFIHQDLALVGSLSTVENLALGKRLGRGALRPTARRAERQHAEQLIAGFGGRFDVERPVTELSAAERTIVAIGRALDGWPHPRNVLVLDEPTAALHGDEVDKLFVAVRRVAERGAGIVFISHRLDEVGDLADRVVCLRDGKLIADRPTRDLDHDDLVRLIAGTAVSTDARGGRETGAPVLRAERIVTRTIAALDLDLHAGEVLGVSGVLGSGREEVAGVLFGAVPGCVESLTVDDRPVGRRDPRTAIAAGLAYVPADRRGRGAVMTMTTRENMTLPRIGEHRRRSGSIDERAERREVADWIARTELRPPEPDRPLELFSGGNQQKVVLAKWLRNVPRALLLDEPTQGVDIGAKAGIYALIDGAAAAGAGVLVCSSDTKELAEICDRVLVMRDGVVVAELTADELGEAALVRAGLGDDGSSPAAPRSPEESSTHA